MDWSKLYTEILSGLIKQYVPFLIVVMGGVALIEILLKLFIRKTSDKISQSKHKNLILIFMILGMLCALIYTLYIVFIGDLLEIK